MNNESIEQTAGRTAFNAEAQFSGSIRTWDDLSEHGIKKWEELAQAVLAAHTPKLTAEDVYLSVREARLEIVNPPVKGECFRLGMEGSQRLAERLNARLSHPQPASVESRPVEVEWEEASGNDAVKMGWKKSECTHYRWGSDQEWRPYEQTVSGASFYAGCFYRRPKKINPQPGILFTGQWQPGQAGAPSAVPFVPMTGAQLAWAEMEAEEKAAPSAESGETPTLEPTGPFHQHLEYLINRMPQESASDTPDFILARFLQGCLDAWNKGIKRREKYYGRTCGSEKSAQPSDAPIP